ncbi:hypothetical protein RN001_011201 [Aquatica leii]|uniref:Uncharacterized protein n=1 Tax=Aquatica leii TaxID=1421715 RepID=A0AAN7P205_9COLE|nr:hypothetical protein RN001_011201 [Aquatica leii]
MRKFVIIFALVLASNQECASQLIVSRGSAEVEKPLLLDSFLPASMQIIAYVTDLMKYETKPADDLTTTTSVRPTPSHKPGIYSPLVPKVNEHAMQYLHPRFKSNGGAVDPSDRNTELEKVRSSNLLPSDIDLLGAGPVSLLKLITNNEQEDPSASDVDRVRAFSENYDDWYRRQQFVIGGKKPPPTRAYVTLLSLYDLLNQESKKLHLNKYGGYTGEVLRVLQTTSKGTSAEQLYMVLDKMVKRRDSKETKTHEKVTALLKDFEDPKSYLNDALKYIPPLYFAL